ncbi:putative BOI-related E3 ubiquitin-protein ligase 3 [Drosera capensis]
MAVQAPPMNLGSMQSGFEQNWLLPLNVYASNEIDGYNLLESQHKFYQQQDIQSQHKLREEQCYKGFGKDEIQHGTKRRLINLDPSTITPKPTSSVVNHSAWNMTSVAALFAKQNRELDAYVELQSQRLRLALQEQNKRQTVSLLRELESKSTFLLTRKDEEIAKANKRTIELHELVRKLEAENQAWKTVAMENEAMVAALNTAIEHMKEKAVEGSPNNVADDAESCCSVVQQKIKNNENGLDGEQLGGGGGVMCMGCCVKNSGVLFLPCRHLCSCIDCASLLDSCPVCKSPQQASIEILFT